MYWSALSFGSFTVRGPLLTKKSPSGPASIPFHLRNTGWRIETGVTFA
jgi:hypothetical protein